MAAASVLAALALPAGAQAAGEVLTFATNADARVSESSPWSNYGASSYLRVDGGSDPDVESYVSFTVSGLPGPVARARLRLRATTGTSNGPTVHAVTGLWQESGITWNTRPAREAAALADLGTVTGSTWAELDVTARVTGEGTYDFALVPASSDGVDFASREAGATTQPELVVEMADGAPVVAAAGDIAGCSWSQDAATALVLDALNPTTLLPLGDTVYEDGTAAEFRDCYEPTWGRHKGISSPVVGNHEYGTSGASGYFDYFGAAAGDRSKGYYAFDVGAWRLYALNTNCSKVSCSAGSTQEQWLRADLAAHPRSCTLAYSHHPRFTSAGGGYTSVWGLYKAFYDASGDIWLAAHQHVYERLARLSPSGDLDAAGVRNFVVGTGGAGLFGIGSPITGSEVRNNRTHGVLGLTLRATGYDWEFTPIAGATFTDSGSDTCVGPAGDTTPPSAPTNLSATAPSGSQVDLSWTASTDDVAVTGYDVLRDGTLIATVTTTGYTDTTVTAGTPYTYTVKARDAADNVSAASNSATVTPADSRTFPAEADARVQEAKPSSNYGSSSYLRVDDGSDPGVESYLRFTVSGVDGAVSSARLRLWVTDGTGNGPAVWSTTASWTESTLTWNNRPARTGSGLDDKGAVAKGTWVEFDVKPLVTGNETYTFILAGTSSDGIDMSSRQASDTTRRPQLVVRWG
ncbi:MAG: DUF7594 domain-containing protein [Solirubrobacteraceae bacterium]